MSNLVNSIEVTLREHLLDAMPDDPNGRLAAKALADLVVDYGTWLSHGVPARSRCCHISKEMRASTKAAEHKDALDVIERKIIAGDDLKPHLSKSVDKADAIDRMHADFGVHHLHLSIELDAKGAFVKRGNDLLFAFFKPDDAYLIGIYEHLTDWARKNILEIAARNWPDAGIVHKLNFVTGLTNEYNDTERLELQKAGISVGAISTEDGVFMTLGQNLTGNPYSATRLRMLVMSALNDWREHFAERLAEAATAVDGAAGRSVRGDWKPVVHNEQIGLQREDVFHPIARLS